MIKVKVKGLDEAVSKMKADFTRLDKLVREEVVFSAQELRSAMKNEIDEVVYNTYQPRIYKRTYALRRSVKTASQSSKFRVKRVVYIDGTVLENSNPFQPVRSHYGRHDWGNSQHKDYSFFVHEGRGYDHAPPPPKNVKLRWKEPQPLAGIRRPFAQTLYLMYVNGDVLLNRFKDAIKRAFSK